MLVPKLLTLRSLALLWQLFMLALVYSMSHYPQAYTLTPSFSGMASSPSQLQMGAASSAIIMTCLQLALSFVGGGPFQPLLLMFNCLGALTATWYWLGPLGELTLIYIELVLIVPPLLIQLGLLIVMACCGGGPKSDK